VADFVADHFSKPRDTLEFASGGMMADHCVFGNLVNITNSLVTSIPGKEDSNKTAAKEKRLGKVTVLDGII
jgi:hypothetical protein